MTDFIREPVREWLQRLEDELPGSSAFLPTSNQKTALDSAVSPSGGNPLVTNSGWDLLRALIYRTPEDFGAVGDDSHDDTTALHSASAWCIANHRPLVLTAGKTYRVTSWQVGSGAGAESILITSHRPGGLQGGCAIVHGTSKTLPAVVCQGLWWSNLENFTVQCDNTSKWGVVGADPSPNITDYIDSGFSNSQNSPQCAIAIDAYGGSTPSGGYPGATYGQYPSFGITFRRVVAQTSVIGFFNYGGNSLAENMIFDGCYGYQCAVPYAICYTQSRRNVLHNFTADQFHTAVDGRSYGAQNGCAPQIEGMSLSQGFRYCNVNTSFQTSTTRNLYMEEVCTIGVSVGNEPTVFDSCTMNLGIGSITYRALVHGMFSGPVRFVSTHISTFDAMLNLVGGSTINTTDFDSCTLKSDVVTSPEYKVCAQVRGGYSRVSIRGSRVGSDQNKSPTYNTDADVIFGGRVALSQATRRVRCYGTDAGYLGNGDLTVRPAFSEKAVGLSTTGSYSWTGSTVVFTASAAGEFMVGDYLYWLVKTAASGGSPNVVSTPADFVQGSIVSLKVTVVSGTTITAVAQGAVGELDTTDMPSTVYVALTDWAPMGALTGTWLITATSITQSNASYGPAIGDFLRADSGLDPITRVTNVVGTTITISKPATAAGTATPIYCSQLAV